MNLSELKKLASEGKLLGCFEVSNEDYHNGPGVSKSMLGMMDKTALHFRHDFDNREETDAMRVGAAIHTLALEPENFKRDFAVKPKGQRCNTAVGRKWLEDNEGKTEITETQMEMIKGMADAIKGNEFAQKLLRGHYERAFYWIDPEFGILCKCKPDIVHLSAGMLVDLKKTTDAGPEEFMRNGVHKFLYHVQNAWYIDGVSLALQQGTSGGLEFKMPDSFVFIAVEEKAPHAIGFYDLPPEFIDEGRKRYEKLLEKYVECNKKKEWKGYPEKIIRLQPKSYMYRS